MHPLRLAAAAALVAVPVAAQLPAPAPRTQQALRDATVQAALDHIDQHFPDQVREWVRITEIPAASTFEQQRAAYVAGEFRALGYEVSVDSIGNVTAHKPGTGDGPSIVFAAHMDTVHPMRTDVTVTREGGRLHAPGVFDNSASVTNMLNAARAIEAAGLRLRGSVTFVGTVQEELGLVGMRYWLAHHAAPDMLVALDGGLGPVNYGALGIYWSRMTFRGEGSHTNTSRGKPHPGRAAARCILDIYDVPLPPPGAPVGAVYNVGMLGGGKVVNAIPQEVWFTVDLRTVDPALLAELDSAIVRVCQRDAAAEGVSFAREWLQRLEAGGRPEQLAERRRHPLVQTAVEVLEDLGWDFGNGPKAVPTGSTDSNAGVVLGIPSIAIGRSIGGNQHTLTEWADIESAKIGTKQIVLLAASLAGVAGEQP